MADKVTVESLGKGKFRILLPARFKFDMKFFVLAGPLNVRVFSDQSSGFLIGAEGEKVNLLAWLRSLEMIDKEDLKSYEEAMTN